MKKVLVASYTFPPVGGAGVQRVSKFVKYLRQFGWEPEVLTTLNPSVPLIDEGLLSDIPDDVVIHRTKTLEPSYSFKAKLSSASRQKPSALSRLKGALKSLVRVFLTPDPQILWWPHTSVALYKLLKTKKYEVVFSSGPPFSSLVLAVFWGARFGVPVVVDFRDEWSFSRNNWENAPKYDFLKWFDRKLERYVLRRAGAVTVASPAYKASFLLAYPWLEKNKIHVITNGYDPADFLLKTPLDRKEDGGRHFSFLYSGTVWKATSLAPFVGALSELLHERPILRDIVRVKVLGRVVVDEEEFLKDLVAQGVLVCPGYVKHVEVVQEMHVADCLLLTLADLPGSEKIIPGKTFEYMAVKAPVLGIIPQGVCADMIRDLPGCIIVEPCDVDKIKRKIIDLISYNIKHENKDVFVEFSREKLTERLTKVFNSLNLR